MRPWLRRNLPGFAAAAAVVVGGVVVAVDRPLSAAVGAIVVAVVMNGPRRIRV